MVDRTVADIVLVHQVHNLHHGLGVVRSVAVDLHVEDVAAAGDFVIGSLNLRLLQSGAVVVDGHVVGVGVVVLVGDAGQDAELLLVVLGEAAGQTLGRRSQHAVVVLIALAELVDAVSHVAYDLQAQLLALLALAVVLAGEGNQTLGQTDEADAQRALVDDGGDGVVGLEVLRTHPQTLHQQGELLGVGRLLELEALVQLTGGDLQQVVELGEERSLTLLLLLDAHALDGELHDVDGGEADVAATYGSLVAEAVLEDTGAAAHRGHLIHIALGIVDVPLLVEVVGGVQVDEVGEETACSHLAGILVEVVVAVGGQIAHALLLLPDLDGENGGFTVAHALVGGAQDLADDAAALGRDVGAVVDGGEDHLVAAARVDGVHVVDEGLHSLVHAVHRLVDGVLLDALQTAQTGQRQGEVILKLDVVELAVVLAHELLKHLHLFNITLTHVRSQVEVESGNALTAVHLVLHRFHRDTADDGGRLDALGGTALAVTGLEAVLEDLVQRVLDAGHRLGGIVVLVVDVQIVVLHGLAHLLGEQVVVDEGLGGLAGELHHHAGGGVGVHVGVLARHVVVLDVDDLQEHVARLGLAGHGAGRAVADVVLGHVGARALHQLVLHEVLNLLHRHLALALHGNAVGDLLDQGGILTAVGGEHGLTNGCGNLLLVEAYDTSVSLKYSLNHSGFYFLGFIYLIRYVSVCCVTPL